MRHPLKRISQSQYAKLFWPLIFLIVILVVLLNMIARPLTTSQAWLCHSHIIPQGKPDELSVKVFTLKPIFQS